MDKVIEIFDQISFGLELETCVHIMKHPLFTPLNVKDESQREELQQSRVKKAVRAYYDCISRKFPGIRFKLILNDAERAARYDQWIIMPDSSIECNYNKYLQEKYCVLQGKRITGKQCKKFAFYPIEIITPKLTGYIGLKYITLFWYGILTAYDMVYSVNETQGLHVNISHPNMDRNSFLNLWSYFEPIILQILSADRRENIWYMAVPVSSTVQIFGSDYDTITQNKFLSVGVKKGNSPRLEVRIQAGSMDYISVTRWLMFCMWFLCLSVVKKYEHKAFPFTWKGATVTFHEGKKGQKKLLDNFFHIVHDSTLISFLNNKYNKNKQEGWPEYIYNGKRKKILRYFTPNDFPQKTLIALEQTKRRSCPK